MELKDIIGGFADAIAATRARLEEVNEDIARLNFQRTKLEKLPPHTDEVVEAFRRGLDDASQNYEQRLRRLFSTDRMNSSWCADVVNRSSAQLLNLGYQERMRDSGLPGLRFNERDAPADVAALTYFLRDVIADQLPALVEKIYPSGKTNKTYAERQQLFAELDAELTALTSERDELQRQLEIANKAAFVRPAHEG